MFSLFSKVFSNLFSFTVITAIAVTNTVKNSKNLTEAKESVKILHKKIEGYFPSRRLLNMHTGFRYAYFISHICA